MKLEILPYVGDSIIRGRPTTRQDPHRQPHSRLEALQRNIATAPPVSALDIAAIEARARALRAAAVAGMLSTAWKWLSTYFERQRRRRDEEYLARARNLAELEQRLRKLERRGQLLHV
jgi:hypothetical protein